MISLNPHSYSALVLCSHLALPESGATAEPLRPKEWAALMDAFAIAKIDGPAALFEMSEGELRTLLMNDSMPGRIHGLVDRRDSLDAELERLADNGIWIVTVFDSNYPARYRERLGTSAPPLLFGAGDSSILTMNGLAIVGSRDANESSLECAAFAANACAQSGHAVFSGGAKGADAAALNAALESGGKAGAVLADSLEKTMRGREISHWIEDGRLVLLTPFSPSAGFSVGAAMGRNKLIYALADFALVVSSDVEKGGTWTGAIEAMRAGWVPLFVLDSPDAPEGNHRLIRKGATPFPHPFHAEPDLWNWFVAQSEGRKTAASQGRLF